MDCPNINNLKFDLNGQMAIEDIRDIYDTAMTAALRSSDRDQQLFFRAVAKGCRIQ